MISIIQEKQSLKNKPKMISKLNKSSGRASSLDYNSWENYINKVTKNSIL